MIKVKTEDISVVYDTLENAAGYIKDCMDCNNVKETPFTLKRVEKESILKELKEKFKGEKVCGQVVASIAIVAFQNAQFDIDDDLMIVIQDSEQELTVLVDSYDIKRFYIEDDSVRIIFEIYDSIYELKAHIQADLTNQESDV